MALGLLVFATLASAHPGLDDKIAAVSRAIAARPADADLLLRRAEFHRLHRDWEAALADYASARRLAPGLAVIDLCVGQLRLEQGQAESAIPAFEAFLASTAGDETPALRSGRNEALVLRGRAYRLLGQDRRAAEDFDAVVAATARPSPDVFVERARAWSALGGDGVQVALAGLDEGLALLGPIISLQLEAIAIARSAGLTDAALARVEAATAGAPRRESWLLLRADILEAAGREAAARAAYEAVLREVDALTPRVRATPGARTARGRAAEALAGLTTVVEP